MGMRDPVFSVLMPVFNTETFVDEAIRSVLDQTFSDFELLILDDGSTDGSWDRIVRYLKIDSRVSCIRNDHRGLASVRNEGVQRARGHLVAFLDSDDYAEPTRLQLQADYLNHDETCVALGGQLLYMDVDGDPLYISDLPLEHEAIYSQLMAGKAGAITQGSAAIRKEGIRAIGGYREKFRIAEDVDLFLRLGEIGRLVNLPQVVTRYRQHDASQCWVNHHLGVEWVGVAIRDASSRQGKAARSLEPPRDRTGLNELLFRAMKAYQYGFMRSSHKYARRALVAAPASPRAWHVFVVSHLGPFLRVLRRTKLGSSSGADL